MAALNAVVRTIELQTHSLARRTRLAGEVCVHCQILNSNTDRSLGVADISDEQISIKAGAVLRANRGHILARAAEDDVIAAQ
jgi:hypothetical protein